MKPRTSIRTFAACAFAACALALLTSGCSDGGDGGPPSRPLSPLGTEPAPVTGSEPTTGGNDMLPGQGRSLEALCAAACTRLESECPTGTRDDCPASCVSAGMSYLTCAAQFRLYVACVAMSPIACSGQTVQLECDTAEAALASCVDSTSR